MFIAVIIASILMLSSTSFLAYFSNGEPNFVLFIVQILGAVYSLYAIFMAFANRRKKKTIVSLSCMGIIFPLILIIVVNVCFYEFIYTGPVLAFYLILHIITIGAYCSSFFLYINYDGNETVHGFLHSLTIGFVIARLLFLTVSFIVAYVMYLKYLDIPTANLLSRKLLIIYSSFIVHDVLGLVFLSITFHKGFRIPHAILSLVFGFVVIGVLEFLFKNFDGDLYNYGFTFED